MLEESFYEAIKRELVNGTVKKRHPFRYFTLATTHNGTPRQRTVVLRKLLPDFEVLIYTDARSQKVEDIRRNPKVSALFYHPKLLMQVRLEGQVEVITDSGKLAQYWQTIAEPSKKDYITSLDPGTAISNPDLVEYLDDQHYFCALKLVPDTIEYLQLKRPHHLRLLFSKAEGKWNGQFLVP
jgi:pyridoxamine 5'-phosphate oxidase